mmetsp:Transcript_30696/g.92190  ORF Transcript_30696/g.92190 Transcript_30696/m.92190 type:complete len:227 (+) Transcript_30696:408-1088(+)
MRPQQAPDVRVGRVADRAVERALARGCRDDVPKREAGAGQPRHRRVVAERLVVEQMRADEVDGLRAAVDVKTAPKPERVARDVPERVRVRHEILPRAERVVRRLRAEQERVRRDRSVDDGRKRALGVGGKVRARFSLLLRRGRGRGRALGLARRRHRAGGGGDGAQAAEAHARRRRDGMTQGRTARRRYGGTSRCCVAAVRRRCGGGVVAHCSLEDRESQRPSAVV